MTSGHGTGSREAAVSVDSEGWNVFVSYACEDREEVGRSLAEILKAGACDCGFIGSSLRSGAASMSGSTMEVFGVASACCACRRHSFISPPRRWAFATGVWADPRGEGARVVP